MDGLLLSKIIEPMLTLDIKQKHERQALEKLSDSIQNRVETPDDLARVLNTFKSWNSDIDPIPHLKIALSAYIAANKAMEKLNNE